MKTFEQAMQLRAVLDNPFIFTQPAVRCGCGKVAHYAVYEDQQPHCVECCSEAFDCDGPILVRRLR